MPFIIKRADITKFSADVIVNTANPKPVIGAGTDSAIYQAAGEKELLAERVKIGAIERGQLAVTPAFKLDAKYIFHTVGPKWIDGEQGETETLKACYTNCVQKAVELGCSSIAFPLISSGAYGFPKTTAVKTAVQTLTELVFSYDLMVYLLIFSEDSMMAARKVYPMIEEEIDGVYVQAALSAEYDLEELQKRFEKLDLMDREILSQRRERLMSGLSNIPSPFSPQNLISGKSMDLKGFTNEIEKELGKLEKDFNERLLELLGQTDRSQAAIAKDAGIQKQHLSKLLLKDSHPTKKVVLALCVSLKLGLSDSLKLLASAGYTIDTSNPQDVVFRSFAKYPQSTRYTVDEINNFLYDHGIELLGTIQK